MWASLARAAIFAALVFATGAVAQDVTLTARDGALSVEGTLQGFDGEFFRIQSAYGPLTIDAEGVICEGPACPSLTAPRARIRILGAEEPGQSLLPGLLAAFAEERGLILEREGTALRLIERETGQVLADVSFAAASPAAARASMAAGGADLVLARMALPDRSVRVVGSDALVAIVAPGNPTPRIASTALARVLAGEVANWSEVGGPDMPLVLHGLAADSDLGQALAARLGKPVAATVRHGSLAELAAAVAGDPWAIAVTGRSALGAARVLPLTDSCGFPLDPSPLAVKAEDYPLALPVFLELPPRRLPLIAREFLEFLDMPAAQRVVAAAGYVDRSEERRAMTADGLRLLNAIKGAGKDVTLADLQGLAVAMDGADRSSLTFRFEDGGSTLDAQSRENLGVLARMIETGAFAGQRLSLVGFSDGSGKARSNLRLSQDRVEAVAAALAEALPGLAPEALPETLAFGEALPLACDETNAGRWLNRRVELWVHPGFVAPPKAEE